VITWVGPLLALASSPTAASAQEQPAPAETMPAAQAAPVEDVTPPEEEPAVRVEPYGLLAASFFWQSGPLANADAPIAVLPGSGASLGATARQSRLGLRAESGPLASALDAERAQVVAEIDFFGGWYADNDITYAMSHPRLRLFYARLSYAAVDVVAGQDWMVFAPLNPVSVVHVAVAGFQGSGNAWARLPQARVELRAGGLSLRAAVLAPASAGPVDPATEPGLVVGRRPGNADRSETPSLQARAAYALPLGDRSLVLGVSGHYAREEVTFGAMPETSVVPSWGVALDFELPLVPWLAIQGELLTGANLDAFFVNADVLDDEPVSVLGGWAQLSFRMDPLNVHVGGGLEDPSAADGQVLPDGAIDQNGAVYIAVLAHAGPLTAGLELSQLWTRRAGTPETRDATHIALGSLLTF